jgi:hypothetical protein
MFTWICPTCGTEVAPSMSECPICSKAEAPKPVAQAPLPAPVAPVPARPAAVTFAPPVAVAPPPVPVEAAPPPLPPAARPDPPRERPAPEPFAGTLAPPPSGLPGWLVGLLVAIGLGAALFAAYQFLPGLQSSSASTAKKDTPVAETAVATAAKGHPLAKFIEISGFRTVEDSRKPALRFLVVNHSSAELPPLTLEINLRVAGAKPDDPPVSTFTVKVPSIDPYDSKEITSQMKSRLRAYEFPDWQFLRADFSVMSPQ